MARRGEKLPARLSRLQRRLERWRRTRETGRRIPESIWQQAAKCAMEFGVSRTATELKVNYYALKRRAQQMTQSRLAEGDTAKSVAVVKESSGRNSPFVEVPAFASCECTIEVENVSGAKMRIALRGHQTTDVESLVGHFWSR